MPKLVVSIDGVVIKEVQITKERTSLGRRPYNDVVIDNLAVSGEHAALVMSGSEVSMEDLGSTNGTYVNGQAVKQCKLKDGDTIEVGKYSIRFVNESEGPSFDKTMVFKPGQVPAAAPATGTSGNGVVKVMSGAGAGREMALTKVVTTLGKPGVSVASISKRHNGFVLAHVEGDAKPTVNGSEVGAEPISLKSGDQIELAGIKMQFIES